MKLARSSAAAIANAIDFERERRIARALTLGFVPESLPELPGYETGLLYAPAAGEPTGGDVYGAGRCRRDEVALLVGDVAGKGVETAALSAMVRFFVEARSWDESSPAQVLTQANAMLAGPPAKRQLRDRVPRRALGALAPLRQRRPPAAADRARRGGHAARRPRTCRSGCWTASATRRASSRSSRASCCSPTPTA